jgi:hypothetical protein
VAGDKVTNCYPNKLSPAHITLFLSRTRAVRKILTISAGEKTFEILRLTAKCAPPENNPQQLLGKETIRIVREEEERC